MPASPNIISAKATAPIPTAAAPPRGRRRTMRAQTSQAMLRMTGSSTSTAQSGPTSGSSTNVRRTPSTKPAAKTATK